MQIVPAILTNNTDEFVTQINKLAPYYQRFSIDVLDNVYAPNHTIQPQEIKKLVTEQRLLIDPECVFDFDLMVMDHQTYITALEELASVINIGFVFLHFSSMKNIYKYVSNDLTIGLSLDPQDQIDDLRHHISLEEIPAIQIMTIKPGYQGQPFIEELLNKVDTLRGSGYESPIFIDGGLNKKTIPLISRRSYKPDFLCVGSYLSKAVETEKAIMDLQEVLKK